MSFIIYNGRLGEDRKYGNVTNVKANTIVDYCISDVDLIPYVCNFKILNFDPLLSDIHCPLLISFRENILMNVLSNDVIKHADCTNVSNVVIENESLNHVRSINCCNNCVSELKDAIGPDEIMNLENTCANDVNVNNMYDALKNTIFNACSKCNLVKDIKPNKDKNRRSARFNNKI